MGSVALSATRSRCGARSRARIAVGEAGDRAVAAARDRDEPRIGRHPDPGPVDLGHMGAEIGVGELEAERPVGGDELDPGAFGGQHLGAGQRRMAAAHVDDQGLAAARTQGGDIARKHVPHCLREVPTRECPVSGRPPVAMITASGARGTSSAGGSQGVEPDIDAEPLHLAAEPAGDAEKLAPPGGPGGKQDLAAQLARCLEQHDAVATQRRNPRRLEAAGTAADNDDGLGWPGGTFDDMAEDAARGRSRHCGDRARPCP